MCRNCRAHRLEIAVTADEAVFDDREASPASFLTATRQVGCMNGDEVFGDNGVHELAVREVPELVTAHLDDPQLRGQAVLDDACRHLGHQDRIRWATAQETRRPIQRRPEHVAVATVDQSGMDRGADVNTARYRPFCNADLALDLRCRPYGRQGVGEHRDDAVTGVLHHLAAGERYRRGDELVVIGKRVDHQRFVLGPQPRRTNDVGEDDRAFQRHRRAP